MSVYVDQYVGFFVDITKEEEEVYSSKLLDNNNVPKELADLGFKPHYGKISPDVNDIEILDDGMWDEYHYLVYIIEIERYSDNETQPSAAVNAVLKTTPVPEEIYQKLAKVYQYIFKKELKREKVFMQQFAHFH